MAAKARGAAASNKKNLILAFVLGQIFMLSLNNVYQSTRHAPYPLASSSPNQNDITQRIEQTTTTTQPRAHRIDRSNLPYKCGMVFFYHVPSTGGATINQWLMGYRDQYGEDNYFTNWGREKVDGSGMNTVQTGFIEGNKMKRKMTSEMTTLKQGGMNAFVTKFKPDEWRVSHCHHSSLHLNVSEHLLSRWRSEVESQGCAFIANVMFRDPLSHSMSLYKHIKRFNSSSEEWNDHLNTASEMGYWQTQLDYFLYNFLARNPSQVDSKTKVRRALEILQNHFDIVAVGNHERFQKELLQMTGWDEKVMKRTNTHTKDIVFTKKEVEELQKLITENGDTAFIYELKKLYEDGGGA